MMGNPNASVLPTREGPTDLDNTVNPINHVNLVDLAIPPRLEHPQKSHIEEHINMEQPPQSTIGAVPQCYAGEIGPQIGKIVIGELHLALGDDIELARPLEAIGQTRTKVQGKLKSDTKKRKKPKKKGPTSTANVRKTKTMEEVLGIEPMEFSEKEEDEAPVPRSAELVQEDLFQPPLSPRSSLQQIKLQEEIKADFKFFLTVNCRCSANVASVDDKYKFYTTFVYVYNDADGRNELWKDLQEIAKREEWVVRGDFNEIPNKDEIIGKKVKFKKAREFMNYIEVCQLEDLKYSGSCFTWSNKRQGNERIYSKIDRVLMNEAWLNAMPNSEAVFMTGKDLLLHGHGGLAVLGWAADPNMPRAWSLVIPHFAGAVGVFTWGKSHQLLELRGSKYLKEFTPLASHRCTTRGLAAKGWPIGGVIEPEISDCPRRPLVAKIWLFSPLDLYGKAYPPLGKGRSVLVPEEPSWIVYR
uniref:Uncharacterized protein n=1 Tax=Cannabis sativa TaxID=3483 RepID=A0A803PA02_CANSA